MPTASDVMKRICESIAGVMVPLNLPAGVTDVAVRSLPTSYDQFDALPVCLVCPAGRPRLLERVGFESVRRVDYPVVVMVIGAGNGKTGPDQVHLWDDWLQKLTDQLDSASPLPNVPEVTELDLDEGRTMDYGAQLKNYAVASLNLRATTFRQTNE